MTKKEYKKARDCIIDYKGTRILMGFRLSFTLLAFLLSLVISGMYIVGKIATLDVVDNIIETPVGELLFMTAFMLIFDPISLFSLVYHGAYSSVSLGAIMDKEGAWDWVSFSNWQYSLLVIGSFILGFVLLMISFKALKKTKKSAGGFIWLMLLLTLENLLCLQRFGMNFQEVGSFWVYLMHGVNLLSLIMCCRSVFCMNYLEKNFEQGASLRLYELKKFIIIRKKIDFFQNNVLTKNMKSCKMIYKVL